jgi:hypothetical protein
LNTLDFGAPSLSSVVGVGSEQTGINAPTFLCHRGLTAAAVA